MDVVEEVEEKQEISKAHSKIIDNSEQIIDDEKSIESSDNEAEDSAEDWAERVGFF